MVVLHYLKEMISTITVVYFEHMLLYKTRETAAEALYLKVPFTDAAK